MKETEFINLMNKYVDLKINIDKLTKEINDAKSVIKEKEKELINLQQSIYKYPDIKKSIYEYLSTWILKNPCPLTREFYIDNYDNLNYITNIELIQNKKNHYKSYNLKLKLDVAVLDLDSCEITYFDNYTNLLDIFISNIEKGKEYKTLSWDWFLDFKPIDNETNKIKIGKELLLKYIELYNIE